jgi:WD40 repeat protein
VAGYDVLEELGRGGMGVVYKARHGSLYRVVALEMILNARFACVEELLRFNLEGEAAASLQHPNIVQVHEVGMHNGLPFLVLEYVPDGTLDRYLQGRPLSVDEAARLIEVLARAVQVAHNRGIVHRDLKPANILLQLVDPDRTDGRPEGSGPFCSVNGHVCIPKVADFGLAKQLDRVGGLTETGRILGTPEYMAPEQATGQTHDIGPGVDIHALGAILYELLCGRPPFESTSGGVDTVLQVVQRDPTPIRRLAARVPRDLETICLKCLQKDPAKRYATAQELAADLERFREGKPIHARPVGLAERTWMWARRHPLTAGLVLALLAVSLLGFAGVSGALVFALAKWKEAESQRDLASRQTEEAEEARGQEAAQRKLAEEARRQEEEQRKRAETTTAFTRVARAQSEWRLSNLTVSSRLLAECEPKYRGWEWHYLQGLHHTDLLTVQAHEPTVTGVEFSPDGKRFMTSGGNPYASSGGPGVGQVRVWDTRTGERLLDLSHFPRLCNRAVFTPDGRSVLAACLDGTLHRFDAATGQPRALAGHSFGRIDDLAVSPDGRWALAACREGYGLVWDLAGNQEIARLHQGSGWIWRVGWSPDGRFAATTSDSHTCIHEVGTWKELDRLPHGARGGIAFAPAPERGRSLVALGCGSRVLLYDLDSRRVVETINGHNGSVLGLAFSPDGRFLATAGADSSVRLWEVRTGSQRSVWRGHRGRVSAVAFHPTGRWVLSGGQQPGEVKLHDVTRNQEYLNLTAGPLGRPVEGVHFTSGGREVIVARAGGEIQVRDARSGSLRRLVQVPLLGEWRTPARLCAFDADGQRLAGVSGRFPRQAQVWNLASGREIALSPPHTGTIWEVCLSADGRRALTRSRGTEKALFVPTRDESVLWDAETGRELAYQSAGADRFSCLALSPDGSLLAEGRVRVVSRGRPGGRHNPFESCGEIRVYRLDQGSLHCLHTFTLPGAEVCGLAFSKTGDRLAVSTLGGWLRVWELQAGQLLPGYRLRAPFSLRDLAFSPDGRLLAGCNRELVCVWDVALAQEVLALQGAPRRDVDLGTNPRLAWSPDGTALAAANWDATVSVWDSADRTTPGYREAAWKAAEDRALGWHLMQAHDAWGQPHPFALGFHDRVIDAAVPGDPELALLRGELYADRGAWRKAVADYQRALAGQTRAAPLALRQLAMLCLTAGDRDGYREACDRLFSLYNDDEDEATLAEVQHALALAPGAPEENVRRARLAELRRRPLPRTRRAWFLHAAALVRYRLGEYDEAIRISRQAAGLDGDWGQAHAFNWITLALALERTGKAEEAASWRARALTALSRCERTAKEHGCGPIAPGLVWWDQVSLRILREELQAGHRR